MLDTAEPRGTSNVIPAELFIWLSPAFPVGSFAYSQGLETSVAQGNVSSSETLTDWLAAIVRHGSLRNDLVMLSLVHRAPDSATLDDLAELAAALQPSKERSEETAVQGLAFMEAYKAAWTAGEMRSSALADNLTITLPVAVGLASRAHRFDLPATLMAFATAFASNLVSAAIRLSVVGQFDGQRVLAALMPTLREACEFAITAGEDDLGTATFAADIASIEHETQMTRLFRS
jgi:urease accessory protein